MSYFSNLKIKSSQINPNYAKFVISPFSKGFGITIGNALRRTLLSGIPGASMFAIKLNKIKHEFSPVEGVIEDVTHIILNLKKLVVKMDESLSDEEIAGWKIESWPTLKLNFKGKGAITAGDIDCPHGFEIVNKNLIIATSENSDTKFDLDIYVTRGKDFRTFTENRHTINAEGIIPTDSNFSPVLNVSYEIEDIKVSNSSFHEQLTLAVSTNGAMSPVDAVSLAADIITKHLSFFADMSKATSIEMFKDDSAKSLSASNAPSGTSTVSTSIADLDLSARAFNSLQREGIRNVSQLTEMTLDQLKSIDNLGSKSIREIKNALIKNGLSIKK
ncbi:MAG: DNA-directed RNA polymerase subunit alpha [Mycoplasmoidaceae bacterium]|nr:MAG: DNA-directed RNA polymerase subunit alpha [Mycoplasmoidaceae bacterium]